MGGVAVVRGGQLRSAYVPVKPCDGYNANARPEQGGNPALQRNIANCTAFLLAGRERCAVAREACEGCKKRVRGSEIREGPTHHREAAGSRAGLLDADTVQI